MNFNTRTLNAKQVLWPIILTALCVVVLCISNLRHAFGDTSLFPFVDSSKIAHYYINYFDFGFVKRGVVGTLVGVTGITPSVPFIRMLGLGIGIVVCGTASFFVYQMRSYFDRFSFFLFAAFILFTPGTIANLGFDLARYDQWLMLCSILSLYFIQKGDFTKLMFVTVAALLIHELYLFFFLPILIYVVVFQSEFENRQGLVLLLAAGIVLGVLFMYGKIETKSWQQIADAVTVKGLDFGGAGTIWKISLMDNLNFTFGYLSTYYHGKIIRITIGGAYTILTFLVLVMIALANKIDWRGLMVVLIAPLPMFFLGIDYSRWFSLMMINGFIYFVYMIINSDLDRITLTKEHKVVMSLLLIIGLILGPIGVIRCFPLFDFF